MAAAKANEFLDVGAAVVFASGAFGGRDTQIRVFHQFVEKRRNRAARLGKLGVFVETFAATGEMLHERVDEHVGGTGVEGEDLRWLSGGGNHCDICDAAEIEGDAAEFGVAIEKVVDVGNERSTLAAEGHVRGTKVRDGGDAGAGGDDRGFADLQRGGGWRAEIRSWADLMKDRLAMAADERNAPQ